MKKLLTLVVVAALTAGTLVGCGSTKREVKDSCEKADGTKACYSESNGAYLVEDGAKIRVGVDNDAWGAAIVAQWDATHPELKGMVEFVNVGSDTLAGQVTDKQGEVPDVLLVIDGQTVANSQSMLALDKYLADLGKANGNENVFSSINVGAPYYLPTAVDGMTFVWNKTMLDALGIDTATDSNNDNLPDAFDTMEEIYAIGDAWLTSRPTYKDKPVNVVFPVSVTNSWSVYSILTAGGWQLLASGDATKPGYDTPEFLEGLKALAETSKHGLSVEVNGTATPGASMGWRWDNVINEEISPFGMVGTWMDVKKAQETTGAEYHFSAMPTYNGKQLTPFFKTKGFVINGFTKFPSAAHEVLRMIYSQEGLQTMIENSSYVPALKDGAAIMPDLSKDIVKQQMAKAFTQNYMEPAGLSLPENPQKGAMDGWYNLSPEVAILPAVYDGTMTPEEAQAELVKLFETWLAENNK